MAISKSETIRLLYREGCSVSEIALAVGYKEKVIKVRLARPRPLAKDRLPWAFNGWRGWPISDKVVSL